MSAVFSIYKYIIGPTLHILGGAGFGCKFNPSCSEYAKDAFLKHSFFSALALSTKRIFRCNPWTSIHYKECS